jgi:hypothetical protein
MELVELGHVELVYRTLASLDFGTDGQLYGTLDGTLEGERLNGTIELTNLAPRRADNVNLPTLRGTLTTADGSVIWLELDGIATLREQDNARVFVTSFRMRSAGDAGYEWVNTTSCVLEGILDSVGVGGIARGHIFECRPTLS